MEALMAKQAEPKQVGEAIASMALTQLGIEHQVPTHGLKLQASEVKP